MKLKGELFYALEIEADCSITDAIVTPRRISIDWSEGDAEAHLDATSRDGVHFQGYYGYPEKDSDFEFELTLFKAKHEYLLFGTWCEHDSGAEGMWVFRLSTKSTKTHTVKTANKPRSSVGRSVRNDNSVQKPSPSASKQGKPQDSKPSRPSPRSAQNGLTKSVVRIESSQDQPKPEPKKETGRAVKLPPASPPPSAQLDHLLEITLDDFEKADQVAIARALNSAPLSAVFKLAHNAKAAAVRSKAADVYAKRYVSVAAPLSTPKPEVSTEKGGPLLSRKRIGRKKR
jgi:hypothetical protein